MDKLNANFENCLESMRKKLSATVIPIQVSDFKIIISMFYIMQ
jgi:hypothetical protein